MAKKKSAGRKSVKSRRSAPPSRRAAPAPKRRTAGTAGAELRLKDLRRQLERAVRSLESTGGKASARKDQRIDSVRARMAAWMADIDDICDPQKQDICGPDMVFPTP